jgi:hypothetical protein
MNPCFIASHLHILIFLFTKTLLIVGRVRVSAANLAIERRMDQENRMDSYLANSFNFHVHDTRL